MKKILSITLAVAFIFAAMSVSVFAVTDNIVGNGKPQGTTTNNGAYTDGADSFSNATGSYDITISFNGIDNNGTPDVPGDDKPVTVIHHKYAVDIEYYDFVIDMTKILGSQDTVEVDHVTYKPTEYVWNVDSHKYELIGTEESPVDPTAPKTAVLTDDNDEPYTMTAYKVVNHSDLPIQYTDEIVDEKIPSALDLTTTLDGDTETVKKAVAGVGMNGQATVNDWNSITAKPDNGKHWIDVVNSWGATNDYNNFVVATLVVTINPAT